MSNEPTLYSAEILEHAKHPHHAGSLDAPTHRARVDNPLCGDRIDLELEVDADQIRAIAHRTRGCALCLASASLLARELVGERVSAAQARASAAQVELERLSSGAGDEPQIVAASFAGLVQAPARRRCVALAWEALQRALEAQR